MKDSRMYPIFFVLTLALAVPSIRSAGKVAGDTPFQGNAREVAPASAKQARDFATRRKILQRRAAENGDRTADSTGSTSREFGIAVVINDHTTTGDDPSILTNCRRPPAKTTFAPTDPVVYQWTLASGVSVGDVIRWEWQQPNGAIYATTNPLFPTPIGNVCFWSRIFIAGQSAATLPGSWQVRVIYNGSVVVTDSFTITGQQGGGTNQLASFTTLPPPGGSITFSGANSVSDPGPIFVNQDDVENLSAPITITSDILVKLELSFTNPNSDLDLFVFRLPEGASVSSLSARDVVDSSALAGNPEVVGPERFGAQGASTTGTPALGPGRYVFGVSIFDNPSVQSTSWTLTVTTGGNTEELIGDSGLPNSAVNIGGNQVVQINCVTPTVFPFKVIGARLANFQVQGQPNPVGRTIDIVSFTGPAPVPGGNPIPPTNPVLTVTPAAIARQGAWADYPIPNGPTVQQGQVLYIGYRYTTAGTGIFPTIDTDRTTKNRSFISGDNGASWRLLALTSGAPADLCNRVLGTIGGGPILNVSPGSLTFNVTPGQGNPQPQNMTVQNTGTGTFSFSISSSDTGLVNVFPTTGTVGGGQASNIQVFVTNPNASGQRSAILTVNAPGAQNSPQFVSVTVNSTGASGPVLSLSTNSLTFNTTVGGGNPQPQNFIVQNTGFGSFNFNINTSDSGLVNPVPSNGTLGGGQSANIQAFVNNPNVSGQRSATLTVNAPGAQNSPQFLTVTVNTTGPAGPVLSVSTNSLVFNTMVGGGNPQLQNFTVQNVGSGSFNFNINTSDSGLVNPVPSNGTLGGGQSASIQAFVNNPNVSGQRSATLTVNAPGAQGSPQFVTVTVNTTGQAGPVLSVSTNSLVFSATVGGGNPQPQSMTVQNAGGGSMNFTINNSDPGLVNPSVGGGVIAGGQSVAVQVFVTNPNVVGQRSATLTVNAPGAQNSPQFITVTVNTTGPAGPVLTVSTNSLVFNTTVGGGNPQPQSITVQNAGTGSFSFNIGTSDSSLANAFPSAATLSAGQAVTVQVFVVNPNVSGQRSATLTITAPGAQNSPQFVSVVVNTN